MKIDIRKLEKQDFAQLKKLYDLLCRDEITKVDTMQAVHKKMIADKNCHVLVAVQGDEVIGSIVGIICQEMTRTGSPFMVIEDMIVKPDNRKQGIGKELVAEMEKLAKSDGCFSIILLSSNGHKSHDFYAKCNYGQRVGFRKDYDENLGEFVNPDKLN